MLDLASLKKKEVVIDTYTNCKNKKQKVVISVLDDTKPSQEFKEEAIDRLFNIFAVC